VRILLTGAAGFLGWHTRVRLQALTDHLVTVVDRSTWCDLPELADGVDAIVHCAGVNRGEPDDVRDGNVELARAVAAAAATEPGVRIVYANSVQAGRDSPYGAGKARARDILAAAADAAGGSMVDVRLPNLFGEHGRGRYNSFVATFVEAIRDGRRPTIEDRQVPLLHVQGAAAALIAGLQGVARIDEPPGLPTSVQTVWDTLQTFDDLYRRGDIPCLTGPLDVQLFNTLRAALFPDRYPIELTSHADHRGRLVETVRAHGGQGQTFISTTTPGITRGEHFHLEKIERFVVVAGQARISLRRLFTDQVVSFDVTGRDPVVVDMPTMWAHNITNTGPDELTTMFWTHVLFDPKDSDTHPEPVDR
jgi:UDP-2-acetamido-2,6-beta-L-arabino-hexul-4-ose reductase